MTSAIGFLEEMGRNGGWAAKSCSAYDLSLGLLDVEPQVRDALIKRDPALLGEAMGGRRKMFCLILEPNEQPARRDDEQKEGDDDDSPKDVPEVRT